MDGINRQGLPTDPAEGLLGSSTPPPQLAPTIVVARAIVPRSINKTEQSEDTMKEKSGNRGPNLGLLLLVPAVVILAKGAMRRRAMWESGWGPAGGPGRRHGHHAGLGAGDEQAEGRAFRLPPKLEWMLDTWHTRAHQAADAADSTTV